MGNIIWNQNVLNLAKEIEQRDGCDPMTALDRAIYCLSRKSNERRQTDHAALHEIRSQTARRGWERRRANAMT